MRVILINYQSIDLIEQQLRSNTFSEDEIILVDNASEPARTKTVGQAVGATVLLNESNVGFAVAVNQAVRASSNKNLPILLLNPDVSIDTRALAALQAELFASDATGVGPVLSHPNGDVQVGTAGTQVTVASTVAYFLFLSRLFPLLPSLFLSASQLRRIKQPTDVDWLCMASLLLRPDAFDVYGTVPEHEIVYAEDTAWGCSASRQGASFRLVPTTVPVVHLQGASGSDPHTWELPTSRFLYRELGPWRGGVAVACFRLGLAIRRAIQKASSMRKSTVPC